MSGTTSVPEPTFGDRGFIAPLDPAILAGVQADMNAAFGGDLNPALETPQGQLASSTTAMVSNKDDQFVLLTNNVDPAYASGRMQDAIARVYFLTRNPALPTTVSCTCGGLPGVVIPIGSLARAQDGNLYASTGAGTIGVGGTVTISFACQVDGPITCPATTLDTIYQQIPGWDSISNPADGVVGREVESRAEFELRRQQTVARNASATVDAILGEVLVVPNVLDAYVTENFTDSPVTSDGVTLPAHSVYVCVAGGASLAVATAIWRKKPPGCDMGGDTTETVTDSNAGYSLPYPTYDITFQTAIEQPFVILVRITDSDLVPSNGLAQIQSAVLAAFAGSDGGSRARIASTVYASRYYAGIQALGAWAEIVDIKLGSSGAPNAEFTAAIASTTMTVSAVASGTLAVGQTVRGAGIPDGVKIAALGSGSGGTGTYTLNLAQTISSEAMTSIAADLNLVEVGLAHVPVLAAANISLTLI